ncbi:hypothetical protein [Burkholderia vietnamiensis]|nr:hypothetical protein [Burkholderia vietnamiensis]
MIESKTFIPKSTDADQEGAYRQLALTQEEISKISRAGNPESGVSSSKDD